MGEAAAGIDLWMGKRVAFHNSSQTSKAHMSAALDGESYDPNRELDGTKGNLLGIAFGVSMRQGSRPYMEDVTVAQAVPGHDGFSVRMKYFSDFYTLLF